MHTNKRNKRKYVSEKKVDVIGTRQKRQRDMGRFEVMQYFDGNKKDMTLMWSALLSAMTRVQLEGGKLTAQTMSVIVKKNSRVRRCECLRIFI